MSIIEHPNHCFECRGNYRGVVLYLVIALVSVTLFYLIILVFQVMLTYASIYNVFHYLQPNYCQNSVTLKFYGLEH